MKHLCLKETQGKMSFPKSLIGNPEDKRTGFRVKHGMTGIREFSGKVSSFKLKVKSYFRSQTGKLASWQAGKPKTLRSSLIAQKGFTLIETIMVMVIIAILAAVVIIRNPFDAIKLSSATRKVAADIRYVQKLSISNQTRAGMVFSVNGYTVYSNIALMTPATSPGDPCSTEPATNNFVVNFTDATRCSNYSGVTITSITFPANTLAFNSLGTPDNAGSVTIGGNTITVEANTGRVSY